MDHLPQIEYTHLPPIEIDYLEPGENSVVYYDNLGFTGFPERAGWTKKNLFNVQIDRPPKEVVAFLQQWLFFGALSTFLGHCYSMETLIKDFTWISDTSCRKIITTKELERYLRDIRPDSETVTDINIMLKELREYVEKYMCAEPKIEHHLRHQSNFSALSLSIQSLGVVLTRAKLRIWPQNETVFAWQWSQIVEERMSEARWCPSDMTMFRKLLTASGLYFISLFPPRLAEKSHAEAGCTKDECKVMNVSGEAKQGYRPIHVEGCDEKCGELEVNADELCKILTTKLTSIPLVRFKVHGIAQLSLSDSSRDREADRYIAISHVWMEGLGNTLKNSLPTCQLTRIQRLVDKLSGVESTPFWMDTLCVPQDNIRPALRNARNKAICSMEQVYRKCSAVLVLDSSLLSTSVRDPLEKKLVSLACSSWLRRLWTLQEGVLGPKIMLQLADGSLDMMQDLPLPMANNPRFYDLSQTVYTELAAIINRMTSLRSVEEEGTRIIKLWNACQFRSTSEHQDEGVCLSILLGNNVNPVKDAEDADKWTTFLLQQEVFPKDLLFTAGPRVERDGFRWAPASFLRRPASINVTLALQMGTGKASKEGFNVQSAGLVFEPLRAPFWTEQCINLFDKTTEKWYLVMERRTPTDGLISWTSLLSKLQHTCKAGMMVNTNLDIQGRALGVFVEILEE